MPKSKVRKKPQAQAARAAAAAATQQRAKAVGPSSSTYVGIMLGLMLVGLFWLVVYYLWGGDIPGMSTLGNWNFAVGFALMIAGLVMTMKWR